jgi:hypothetical protein
MNQDLPPTGLLAQLLVGRVDAQKSSSFNGLEGHLTPVEILLPAGL